MTPHRNAGLHHPAGLSRGARSLCDRGHTLPAKSGAGSPQRASVWNPPPRDSKSLSAIHTTEYGCAGTVIRHGHADVAVPLRPRQVTPDDRAGSSDRVVGPQRPGDAADPVEVVPFAPFTRPSAPVTVTASLRELKLTTRSLAYRSGSTVSPGTSPGTSDANASVGRPVEFRDQLTRGDVPKLEAVPVLPHGEICAVRAECQLVSSRDNPARLRWGRSASAPGPRWSYRSRTDSHRSGASPATAHSPTRAIRLISSAPWMVGPSALTLPVRPSMTSEPDVLTNATVPPSLFMTGATVKARFGGTASIHEGLDRASERSHDLSEPLHASTIRPCRGLPAKAKRVVPDPQPRAPVSVRRDTLTAGVHHDDPGPDDDRHRAVLADHGVGRVLRVRAPSHPEPAEQGAHVDGLSAGRDHHVGPHAAHGRRRSKMWRADLGPVQHRERRTRPGLDSEVRVHGVQCQRHRLQNGGVVVRCVCQIPTRRGVNDREVRAVVGQGDQFTQIGRYADDIRWLQRGAPLACRLPCRRSRSPHRRCPRRRS